MHAFQGFLSDETIIHAANESCCDVSVIITFHREGLLAKRMLDGFVAVRDHAEKHGISVQLVCVLDTPDCDTQKIVCNNNIILDNDWILVTEKGDPGNSRNVGISFANGTYICVVDGDDYYSVNWITEAYHLADQYGASVVVHPEYVVSFGAQHALTRLVDQRLDSFPLAACASSNPWVSTAFAHATIFRSTPYLSTYAKISGFGFEDWHWNLEVIAKGVLHILASNTALYYRRKKDSILITDKSQRAVIRPSIFFEFPEFWENGFPLADDLRTLSKVVPQYHTVAGSSSNSVNGSLP